MPHPRMPRPRMPRPRMPRPRERPGGGCRRRQVDPFEQASASCTSGSSFRAQAAGPRQEPAASLERLARRQVIVDVVETHLRLFLDADLTGVRAALLLRKPVEYLPRLPDVD